MSWLLRGIQEGRASLISPMHALESSRVHHLIACPSRSNMDVQPQGANSSRIMITLRHNSSSTYSYKNIENDSNTIQRYTFIRDDHQRPTRLCDRCSTVPSDSTSRVSVASCHECDLADTSQFHWVHFSLTNETAVTHP